MEIALLMENKRKEKKTRKYQITMKIKFDLRTKINEAKVFAPFLLASKKFFYLS